MAKKFSELRDKMSPESRARSDAKAKEMLDALAPASCSEVVERLAQCIKYPCMHKFDRKEAEKILHEWRERRVQELEEALRAVKRELRAISRDGLLTKADMQLLEAAESVTEDALAKSDEWREQIRKGQMTKHSEGTRSIDSGSSGTEERMAKETREDL